MKIHEINVPIINKKILNKIKAGDKILISGDIYTARDMVHKKLSELLKKKKKLPINLKNTVIYYAGPSSSKNQNEISSIGPTSSYRMDKYTNILLKNGISITIGKGNRSKYLTKNFKKYKSIYCATYGGAGAFLASKIKKFKQIAFKEYGPEAIYQLKVKNFPMIVINDIFGNNFYEIIKKRGKNEK